MSWMVSGFLYSFTDSGCKVFVCCARGVRVWRNAALMVWVLTCLFLKLTRNLQVRASRLPISSLHTLGAREAFCALSNCVSISLCPAPLNLPSKPVFTGQTAGNAVTFIKAFLERPVVRAEEAAQWLRAAQWLLLQETWIQFLALTTAYYSSSRGSDAHFWPRKTPDTQLIHKQKLRQSIH